MHLSHKGLKKKGRDLMALPSGWHHLLQETSLLGDPQSAKKLSLSLFTGIHVYKKSFTSPAQLTKGFKALFRLVECSQELGEFDAELLQSEPLICKILPHNNHLQVFGYKFLV